MKRRITTAIIVATCFCMGSYGQGKWEKLTMNNRDNGWLNHIDVGLTLATSGIGFDVAVPMTDWARLRVGGVWKPFMEYNASFSTEVARGLPESEQKTRFNQYATFMKNVMGTAPKRSVLMEGDLKMNNFRLLVDLFPLKNHRNFHVTVGFLYGNSTLVNAHNSAESVRNLSAINALNTMYKRALAKDHILDLEVLGYSTDTEIAGEGKAIEKLRSWGATGELDENGNRYFAEYALSLPLGTLTRDVIAEEDIYYDYSEVLDNSSGESYTRYRTDANGRTIKQGELRYRKGEVIYSAGETLRFVPSENSNIKATATVNKFKPYIGAGYSIPITKDKRTVIAADAGVIFWGGRAKVEVTCPVGVDATGNYVYSTIDMTHQLENMPSKVEKYINRVKKYGVFPEFSFRISQRLW